MKIYASDIVAEIKVLIKRVRWIAKICHTLNNTTEIVTQKNWIKKRK